LIVNDSNNDSEHEEIGDFCFFFSRLSLPAAKCESLVFGDAIVTDD
jgi:hypothetical protein